MLFNILTWWQFTDNVPFVLPSIGLLDFSEFFLFNIFMLQVMEGLFYWQFHLKIEFFHTTKSSSKLGITFIFVNFLGWICYNWNVSHVRVEFEFLTQNKNWIPKIWLRGFTSLTVPNPTAVFNFTAENFPSKSFHLIFCPHKSLQAGGWFFCTIYFRTPGTLLQPTICHFLHTIFLLVFSVVDWDEWTEVTLLELGLEFDIFPWQSLPLLAYSKNI